MRRIDLRIGRRTYLQHRHSGIQSALGRSPRALGAAVSRASGVAADRMTTVSFGDEQPKFRQLARGTRRLNAARAMTVQLVAGANTGNVYEPLRKHRPVLRDRRVLRRGNGPVGANPARTGARRRKPARDCTAKPATQKPMTSLLRHRLQSEQEQQSMPGRSRRQSRPRPDSRAVKAGGESLAAGSYQLRVTETPATPPAPGQTPQFERWAEFLRGGKVVAREVVTVVPASDIKQVAEMTPPPSGGSRTDVLKGNDYLRLWVNRGGNHYLVHFPM